jgi:hypothetical protein
VDAASGWLSLERSITVGRACIVQLASQDVEQKANELI